LRLTRSVKKHPRRRPPPKQRRAAAPKQSLFALVDELRGQFDDGEVRWWHGGAPGLQPGDLILPAIETETLAASDKLMPAGKFAYSPSWVYVADKIDMAIIFAGRYRHGMGDVYEVEPVGEMERDPDSPHDCTSLMCQQARIIRRIPVDARVLQKIKSTQVQAAMHTGRFQFAKGA
jgi:hypothetical protein